MLGLEKLPRPDLGFAGAWLRTGQQEMHLLSKSSGAPPEQHYAFLISDADELLLRLAERDIEPTASVKFLAYAGKFSFTTPVATWWSSINV